jgi:DNA-binding transcriptional regulator YhcF (GntR family)
MEEKIYPPLRSQHMDQFKQAVLEDHYKPGDHLPRRKCPAHKRCTNHIFYKPTGGKVL